MKTLSKILLVTLIITLLPNCKPKAKLTKISKEEYYSSVYAEMPQKILFAHAENLSTTEKANMFYDVSIGKEIINKGYYALPYSIMNYLTVDANKINVNDRSLKNLQSIGDLLQIDAILYAKIKEWKKHYYVVDGYITVVIEFELVSVKTGNTLWATNFTYYADLNPTSYYYVSTSCYDLIAYMIIDIVVTGVNTIFPPVVNIANNTNNSALLLFPSGMYHPRYQVDKTDLINIPK